MEHTVDAVIYDPVTFLVSMTVVPDYDNQLDDPSYNPDGLVQLRVPHIDWTDPLVTAQEQIPELVRS